MSIGIHCQGQSERLIGSSSRISIQGGSIWYSDTVTLSYPDLISHDGIEALFDEDCNISFIDKTDYKQAQDGSWSPDLKVRRMIDKSGKLISRHLDVFERSTLKWRKHSRHQLQCKRNNSEVAQSFFYVNSDGSETLDWTRHLLYDENQNELEDSVVYFSPEGNVLRVYGNVRSWENGRLKKHRSFGIGHGESEYFYNSNGSLKEYLHSALDANLNQTGIQSSWKFFYDSKRNLRKRIKLSRSDSTDAWIMQELLENSNQYNVDGQLVLKDLSMDGFHYARELYNYSALNLLIDSVYIGLDSAGSERYRTKSSFIYDNQGRLLQENRFNFDEVKEQYFLVQILYKKYSEGGNLSQVSTFQHDTLTNEDVLQHESNYYWEAYLHDESFSDLLDLVVFSFPNPVQDIASFVARTQVEGLANFKVYNNIGQLLYQEEMSISKGSNHFFWDASAQPTGLYFAELQIGNLKKTVKIIKN